MGVAVMDSFTKMWNAFESLKKERLGVGAYVGGDMPEGNLMNMEVYTDLWIKAERDLLWLDMTPVERNVRAADVARGEYRELVRRGFLSDV